MENGGGGMYNRRFSNPALTNVTFTGNIADRGGGIYNIQSSPTLTNVTFTGNQAPYRGGGMYNRWGEATLTNVTLNSNTASYGGGMYNDGLGDLTHPTLTNVTFSGNTADYGGGMFNEESFLILTNIIFSGNEAVIHGGGVYNTRGDGIWGNITISGNRAVIQGGGVYNDNYSPVIANSILWSNAAPIGAQMHNEGTSAPYVLYSDIEGGYPGEGNSDADPLFIAPVSPDQAPTTAGDYRLSEGSPPVDAGTNDVVPEWAITDLDGNPRIVDGLGDGSVIVDIGAYEFQIPLLTIIKQGEGLVTSTPGFIDCGDVCTGWFLTGTQITLTATADLGWTFAGWSGVCTGTGACQVMMDNDTAITTTFTQDQYVLNLTVVGEGNVDAAPDKPTYIYGDTVTLTATADVGWTFTGWSGDINNTENPLLLVIEGDTAITTTFTQDQYVLNLTVAGEGNVDAAPDKPTYIYGDTVTLTATADVGWTFAGWSGDASGTDAEIVVTIEGNAVITASFTQDEYALDVNIIGEGTVDVNPERDTYTYGQTITLTETAAPGWTFDSWSGDVPEVQTLYIPLQITMDGHKVVTATFTQDQYTLDVEIVGEGTVNVDPEKNTYVFGDEVMLTATAGPEWTFDGWSGDTMGTDELITYTIEGNTVITATFTEIVVPTYMLTVIINPENMGTITLNPPDGIYEIGTIVTITTNAVTNWEFVSWSGDPVNMVTTGTATIKMDSNKTVIANFTQTVFTIFLPVVLHEH